MIKLSPTMKALTEKLNVEFIDKGHGHVQFVGKFIINYYPESKKRTAYIAGTKKGIHNVSFNMAIKMANRIPPIKNNHRKRIFHKGLKEKLMKINPAWQRGTR